MEMASIMLESGLIIDRCVLLTSTPEGAAQMIARRGETTHSGVDVNNTHLSMINPLITHAPLFRRGEDYVCESPLCDSSFVINKHNPFMHCVTSQYIFKLLDVILLLHAVTMVTI